MSLQEKVLRLKLDAAVALRHAAFWQRAINEHGETKATAFYTHLGLNHIEKKSYEWDGLTLSREPKEHEKLCVKGISQAQDSGKASVSKVLLESRTVLIEQAMKGIKKLSPATYHKLILTMPADQSEALQTELSGVFRKGRRLVAQELGATKADDPEDDEEDELDTITELTDSRLANDVQSRITAAATRFSLLGLTGKALWDAVEKEVSEGSTGYVERAASGAANRTLSMGRGAEMRDRADDIDRYEQSELLDQNTCGPCAEDDGKTASDPDDLPGSPNPDCEGQDLCRGFIIAIAV